MCYNLLLTFLKIPISVWFSLHEITVKNHNRVYLFYRFIQYLNFLRIKVRLYSWSTFNRLLHFVVEMCPKFARCQLSSQSPWAEDGWKKICQPCSLKTKVFALPKGQNKTKIEIFQPGHFLKNAIVRFLPYRAKP